MKRRTRHQAHPRTSQPQGNTGSRPPPASPTPRRPASERYKGNRKFFTASRRPLTLSLSCRERKRFTSSGTSSGEDRHASPRREPLLSIGQSPRKQLPFRLRFFARGALRSRIVSNTTDSLLFVISSVHERALKFAPNRALTRVQGRGRHACIRHVDGPVC